MKVLQKVILALAVYGVLSAMAGVVVSEGSLHLRHLPLRHTQEFAAFVNEKYHAELENVSIHAEDGVPRHQRSWGHS